MQQPGKRALATAVACMCLLTILAAASAHAADKKEVVEKARASYYSLKSNGLVEFQCNFMPDWDALLADERKADPAHAAGAIRTLKQLQFTVSLGTSGSAKVTHTAVTPVNDEMAKGLNQIFGGMEQMVSGFFDTWSPFMVGSPLPAADSNYQLEELPNQWNLSYKEGKADVAATMNKGLGIKAVKVTTAEFNSSIQPKFFRTPRGLVLTGYHAEYYGKSPDEATKLNVWIGYQEVDGLQLPETLSLGGSYGRDPFQIEVTFSGCKATKR
jgi:hypothetical protein